MRSIRLEGISKSFGDGSVLKNINLTIPGGKFFALLGPSGCGKTTLLRLIAGFEMVDSGKIFLGDKEITDLPINKRHVNTVFQNYALFPHLNVFDNVAYGLRIKKIPEDQVETRVIKILNVVNLESHIYKPIHELSGGQQQRIALARAIINEPEVLLLDEPLGALDFNLREKMLVELKDIQSNLETTFVYVTHDQSEALTLADQMAIMNEYGEIEQLGTPKEVYEFPATAFVADFVGNSNVVAGTLLLDKDKASVCVEGLGTFDVYIPVFRGWMDNNIRVLMSLRPEKIEINKEVVPGFANALVGSVEAIIYQGRSTQYSVRLKNGMKLLVFEQNEEHFPREVINVDDEVNLYWQKENAVVMER